MKGLQCFKIRQQCLHVQTIVLFKALNQNHAEPTLEAWELPYVSLCIISKFHVQRCNSKATAFKQTNGHDLLQRGGVRRRMVVQQHMVVHVQHKRETIYKTIM